MLTSCTFRVNARTLASLIVLFVVCIRLVSGLFAVTGHAHAQNLLLSFLLCTLCMEYTVFES